MATLDGTNNYITALVGASADAQGNLYKIGFSGGAFTDLAESLTIRVDNFTPPATSQDKYDVKFVTASIPRPRAKVNVTRNFGLAFRVDANYTVYKALLEQQKVTFNAARSYVATDIQPLYESNKLFDVTVEMIDDGVTTEEDNSTKPLYKFDGCWISTISPISYKTGSSDPASVNFTINFLKMNDLQTGIN